MIWILACAAIENQAPKFVSVAGIDTKHDILTDEYSTKDPIIVDLGESFAVEVKDPERTDVAIWIPFAPAGVSFDADAHTIVVDDAGDLTATWFAFRVIAQDSSRNPEESLCSVSGWITGSDTGYPTTVPR